MKLTWKEVSPYSGQEIEEDAPTNSAGGGNVHGIGVGPYGEPGINPKKKKKHQILVDRGSQIDGHQTFIRTMAHTQRPSGDGALLVAGMVMGDARTVVEACQVTCAEQLGQAVRCLQNGLITIAGPLPVALP